MVTAAVGRLRELLSDGTEVTAAAARWRSVLALLLSLAGLGVSAYLTVDHFAKIRLVCSDAGVVNCQKVTTSAQSHFLGIPVAVLGLAFYVAMTALNLPAAWRAADRRVHLARLALAAAGILFVLYLVAAELLIIGNICLWCTSVHVITFLLLILLLTTIPPMLGWGGPVAEPEAVRGGRAPRLRRQDGAAPSAPGPAGAGNGGRGRSGATADDDRRGTSASGKRPRPGRQQSGRQQSGRQPAADSGRRSR